MENKLAEKEKETQQLQDRVTELERQLNESMLLARLPGENPNPVVRASEEGIVLYCNPPAARLPGWRCEVNERLPIPIRRLVQQALTEGHAAEQDILLGEKIYAVSAVPIPGESYANVYGHDITEHKKAEDALRESERRQREIARLLELDQARLAAILTHLPVGVWIVDQQGRLTGSNPQADRIWAGEAPLLNGIADYQKYVCWYPESGELLKPEEYSIAVALRTGEPVEPMEINIRRFDGSEGTVLASAVPIKDNQGRLMGVVAVNVDISELKKAEEALRRSEERFAKAFQATPDAIVISRMADGLILEVNDGWRKLFGHDPEEVIGRTSLELGVYINPDDRREAITQLQEKGSLDEFEIQIRRKSGEVRLATMSAERLEISGVNCLLTVMRDITERKQSERAIRESEWRLRRAQEIAHLGSWELDLTNNELTWSDEVYRIFGLQPQQFAATYESFLEAVHPEDRAAVDAAYLGSIKEGRDSYEIEHRVIRRSSGEVRIVHEKCEHFRNQDGQIIRSVGMVHDITEGKHAEERLKDYAKRLERSNIDYLH
jgi:PAS domain S-box-containing protein